MSRHTSIVFPNIMGYFYLLYYICNSDSNTSKLYTISFLILHTPLEYSTTCITMLANLARWSWRSRWDPRRSIFFWTFRHYTPSKMWWTCSKLQDSWNFQVNHQETQARTHWSMLSKAAAKAKAKRRQKVVTMLFGFLCCKINQMTQLTSKW